MRNLFFLIQLFLIFSLATAIYGQRPNGLAGGSYHSGQANYMISRYVIGSGGVTGADGTNYIHWATAGETVVGGMQGANNFLLSGFWLPAGYGTGVDLEEAVTLPTSFELHQNYPNPFSAKGGSASGGNPQTTIQYDLPKACKVTVEIFNIVGQRIRLLSSRIQGPGSMQVVWDGRNERGEAVGSGIYLYRLTAHSINAGESNASVLFQEIKKMLLVK